MNRSYRIAFVGCLAMLMLVLRSSGLGNEGVQRVPRSADRSINPLYTYGPELSSPLSTLNESFEGTTFPPTGWIKISPDGGTGWNRQTAGTSPIPGWTGGRITAPPGGSTDDARADDDEEGGPFFHSVNGPGVGKNRGLAGAGGAISSAGVGPAFSLGFAHGITEVADFGLRSDVMISTERNSTDVLVFIDPSFIFRPTAKRSMEANVGAKFGPQIFSLVLPWGLFTMFDVAPGLLASFGSSKVQVSLDVEFPIAFAVWGSVTGWVSGLGVGVIPSIALEGNVGGSTNLFVKLAIPWTFVSILAGVTF